MGTRIKADSDVVAERIGDEIVLVHMGSNEVFELSTTAARFWELAAAGEDLESIRRILLAEFDVSEEQLDREVDSFLDSAREKRLVHVESTD